VELHIDQRPLLDTLGKEVFVVVVGTGPLYIIAALIWVASVATTAAAAAAHHMTLLSLPCGATSILYTCTS
jgi:hypothetical protein